MRVCNQIVKEAKQAGLGLGLGLGPARRAIGFHTPSLPRNISIAGLRCKGVPRPRLTQARR